MAYVRAILDRDFRLFEPYLMAVVIDALGKNRQGMWKLVTMYISDNDIFRVLLNNNSSQAYLEYIHTLPSKAGVVFRYSLYIGDLERAKEMDVSLIGTETLRLSLKDAVDCLQFDIVEYLVNNFTFDENSLKRVFISVAFMKND